jgi:hypothetical protein
MHRLGSPRFGLDESDPIRIPPSYSLVVLLRSASIRFFSSAAVRFGRSIVIPILSIFPMNAKGGALSRSSTPVSLSESTSTHSSLRRIGGIVRSLLDTRAQLYI